MKSFIQRFMVLVALVGGAFNAHATLVQENSSFGLNSVILDTTTGARWLSLNFTLGKSFDQVSSQLATTYAGYSVASLNDVTQFVTDAGVTPNGGVISGTNSELDSLLNMWGITGHFNQQNFTYAATSTTDPQYPGEIAVAVLTEWFPGSGGNPPVGWIATTTPNNFDASNYAYIYGGVALVQAVPEPETYAMLLSGLGIMGWVGRRKKQQSA